MMRLALDWTPNINHIGFFVAQHKGFYKEAGVEVEIIDPSADNYAVTPAKKVEMGMADLALCPTESVISYQTKKDPFPLIGIATIFQEDVSAIVVKGDAGISSPKDLDGKSYASYKARFEDEIVKQMIRNDGGQGELTLAYPDKLGIWETVMSGAFDATWIFVNWEGVEAEGSDIPLTYFRMKDYEVPYSYSPLIAIDERKLVEAEQDYKNFLSASKAGYLYAVSNPEEANSILRSFLPEKDQKIDLKKALDISAPAFGTEESWGKMDPQVVGDFLQWIYDHGLESIKLEVSEVITNQCF
ncbi:MAG: ABC transporter substrate-binding protein [Bacteroidota bacterium]